MFVLFIKIEEWSELRRLPPLASKINLKRKKKKEKKEKITLHL